MAARRGEGWEAVALSVRPSVRALQNGMHTHMRTHVRVHAVQVGWMARRRVACHRVLAASRFCWRLASATAAGSWRRV